MAKEDGRDMDNLDDIVEDIESLGVLDMTDFENMDIMREDETFATMVEEHISEEEMDKLSMAFRDLEDQISVPTATEDFASIELSEGEFGDMSEDDLDAMLKSLMQDEGGDEDWVPMDNIDDQLAQEPEFYEGENDERDLALIVPEIDEETSPPKKSPRKWMKQQYHSGDKSTKILVISIWAMGGLVAASLLFVVGLLIATNTGNQETGTFNLSPPAYAFNNASHSLVNLSAPLGDDTIVLNRLLLDEVVTSFYFGGFLDPSRYIFALEDFNGRIYSRNVSLATNPVRDQALNQTVVRFEAMDSTAEGFTISVTDLHTGQTSSIELTFDADAIAVGRFTTSHIVIDTGLSDITLSIDSGVFSAAASSFNFSMSYANPNVSLVFGQDTGVPPVLIRHMGATVPVISNLQTSSFPQDGITLGAMDFNPLRSLTGRVEVVFGQIYKRYELNTSIATIGMFAGDDDRARTIELADHIINIHGLLHQGHFFVMPLYGTPRVQGEDAERLPTTMEVTLFGVNDYGQQARLPGVVRYDARGTDVTFDIRENEAILDIPLGRLFLDFESVSVRLPEFSAFVYLDDADFAPHGHTSAVKSAIEAAFAQDLPQFAAQFDATHNVEHAVQVRQIHFDGDNVYARVAERLAFTDDGGLQEVIRHLRISAVVTATNVEITSVIAESVEHTQ